MSSDRSFDLPCDWKSGFLMDPNNTQRCGYLTVFDGLDLTEPTSTDELYKISVFTPYNGGEPQNVEIKPKQNEDDGLRTIDCIGIIDHFSWGGGAGDPICISAYVSTEFASQLKAKQKTTMKNRMIKKLGWWIVNYDVEGKAWFEEAYPKSTNKSVSGQLTSHGSTVALQVAANPTRIAPNIDVTVYQIYLEVVPGANARFSLGFALGKDKPFVNGWGLEVGTIAKQAMPPAA